MLLVGLVERYGTDDLGLAVSFWWLRGLVAGLVMAVLLSPRSGCGRERLGALPINAWLGGASRQTRSSDD